MRYDEINVSLLLAPLVDNPITSTLLHINTYTNKQPYGYGHEPLAWHVDLLSKNKCKRQRAFRFIVLDGKTNQHLLRLLLIVTYITVVICTCVFKLTNQTLCNRQSGTMKKKKTVYHTYTNCNTDRGKISIDAMKSNESFDER